MAKNVTRAAGSMSLDGGRFRLDTDEWEALVPVTEQKARSSRVDEGLVSVDGGWFDPSRGTWKADPPRVQAELRTRVPKGFVSVDGALLPVEPN